MFLANNFESTAANGTAISHANSGGVAGTAWDAVDFGSGASGVYSTSSPLESAKSGVFTTGATGALARVKWTTALGGTFSRLQGRALIQPTLLPTAPSAAVIRWAAGNVQAARISIASSGKISIRDAASSISVQSVGAMGTSDVWLLRWDVVFGPSGSADLYIHYDPTSATPDEHLTISGENFGTAAIDEFDAGITATVASSGVRLDALVCTDEGVPPGPFVGNEGGATFSPGALGFSATGRRVGIITGSALFNPGSLGSSSAVPVWGAACGPDTNPGLADSQPEFIRVNALLNGAWSIRRSYQSTTETACPAQPTGILAFRSQKPDPVAVTNGSYDSLIRSWAISIGHGYATIQHEADQPAKGISAATYDAMFNHFATIAKDANPNIKIGPVVTEFGIRTRDGYNYCQNIDPSLIDFWGFDTYADFDIGYRTFEECCADFAIPYFQDIDDSLPFVVAETGIHNVAKHSGGGHTVGSAIDRAQWIYDGLVWAGANNVTMLYYNVNTNDNQWKMTSGETSALLAKLDTANGGFSATGKLLHPGSALFNPGGLGMMGTAPPVAKGTATFAPGALGLVASGQVVVDGSAEFNPGDLSITGDGLSGIAIRGSADFDLGRLGLAASSKLATIGSARFDLPGLELNNGDRVLVFYPPSITIVNRMGWALRTSYQRSMTVWKDADGVWQAQSTPANDTLKAAQRTLAVGGRPQIVDAATAQELTAAGVGHVESVRREDAGQWL